MTLSISEHNENDGKWAGKLAKGYGVVSAVTFVFSMVYEYNSHGVYSSHMLGLALYPLLGGVLIFCLLARFVRNCKFHWITVGTYQAALLTFMAGSLVRGILDIYGTSSPYTSVYWWVGTGFSVICAGSLFVLTKK